MIFSKTYEFFTQKKKKTKTTFKEFILSVLKYDVLPMA